MLILLLVVLGRRADARELAAFVPHCLILFKRLLGDSRVPRRAKVALGLGLLYVATPFDVIPDFVPVAGQLDDAILVAAIIGFVARTVGNEVIREVWPGSERGLAVVLALTR